MEDYYKLLGLDSEATQESIKAAYRRLARKHHPDRNIGSNESESKAFSQQMVQLNEAYSILSDAKQRREYDDRLKLLNSLQAPPAPTRAPETVTKSKTNHHRAPAPRNNNHNDVDATLAHELAKQLRSNLMKHHKAFTWEETTLEGFDWGLEGSSGLSHYCVVGRGFGVLDLAAAKKVTNYADVIISRYLRPVRKSHFLFLIPFQRLNEWELVSAELNRFFSAESHSKLANVPIRIVLMDARQGRSMRFGTKAGEKKIDELMHSVSTPS